MKKLVCLMLALSMLFTLAACGQKTAPAASAAKSSAAQSSAKSSTPAEAKVMKIAGTMSQKETDGEYLGTQKFAELVEQYTNGSIKVEIYPSSQLGGQTEFSEGVMLGSIEACVLGPSYFGTTDPFMYFLEMPYLFKNLDHARALFETENAAKKEIDSHLAALNLIQVGTLYRSPRVWCNNLRPVKSIADNKGIRMRTPESPISVSLVTALGASPVTVAWSEVYTGLSSGVCDGVENAITELYNNNMQEVVKYCSETNHMLNSQGILVSKVWFDSLSADEQAAIQKAGLEATKWRAEQLNSEVDMAWKGFADKGVQILKYDDLDIDSFSKAAQSVLDEYIKKGNFTQEFIDQIKSLA